MQTTQRLTRNLGSKTMKDTIREIVMARADELGLSANGVMLACVALYGEKAVSTDAVKRYFNDQTSLKSKYLSQICEVLSLQLTPVKRTKREQFWDKSNTAPVKVAKKKKKTKTVG